VVAASAPLHVTLRIVGGLPSLRRERVVRIVRTALAGGQRDDFRVVHFNVLANHLHLLVEADGATPLARGMQGLSVRLARRINAELGRAGALLAERYHARSLRTPREVRNAIRYVLLNARHHAAEGGVRLSRGWLDPFSSALWFDGWRDAIRTDAPWLRALARTPRPTAAPRTWLLSVGWRRGGGPIPLDDVPGPSP
jgi:REP element-mobilizing transposase RayT